MKHVMNLHEAPYNLIKSGIKTIELRLYDEKRRAVAVGDEIEFKNSAKLDLSLCCRVTALYKFSSFVELYKSLPLLKCGYTESDIATATPDDMNLYYSKERQSKYGVVGIEVEVLG